MINIHVCYNALEKCIYKKKYPEKADLLLVELTDVLERLRRLQMESPQLTTPPLLVMLKVRSRYRSSDARGLYGFSGSEQTRGLECSTRGGNSNLQLL